MLTLILDLTETTSKVTGAIIDILKNFVCFFNWEKEVSQKVKSKRGGWRGETVKPGGTWGDPGIQPCLKPSAPPDWLSCLFLLVFGRGISILWFPWFWGSHPFAARQNFGSELFWLFLLFLVTSHLGPYFMALNFFF